MYFIIVLGIVGSNINPLEQGLRPVNLLAQTMIFAFTNYPEEQGLTEDGKPFVKP